MNPQVNWQKIRDEFQRLTDVEHLKTEVHRIGAELRKFDLQSVLSPAAQEKVKRIEKRYAEVVKTLSKAQVQVDREFTKLSKQIKEHRADVTKVVNEQKHKLEKISSDLKARFAPRGGSVTYQPTKTKRAPKATASDVVANVKRKAKGKASKPSAKGRGA